jgi:hypothetical protein
MAFQGTEIVLRCVNFILMYQKTQMPDIDSFKEKLLSLISKFEKDKTHYLSKGYPEAQVRVDFINPLFKALGWDIENKAQKPPHERDVIVELSPETTGRPDYNFRIIGATKFFGIWKNMSSEENAVLEEIQARRKRTYRARIL